MYKEKDGTKRPMRDDGTPLEIERKYLIEYPDMSWIENYPGMEKAELTQIYYSTENEKRDRVRCWKTADKEQYFLTKKQRITGLVHIEVETEITKEEFENLPKEAAGPKKIISKVRYCLPYGKHTLELDIYPFWDDKATVEVELESENEEVTLPPEIKVIKEVTEDRSYTSFCLAHEFT